MEKNTLKKKRGELKKLKDDKTQLQKERLDEESSLGALIEEILVNYDIKPQAFHGGAMNGVCIQQLLNNIDDVMGTVKTIAMERLEKRHTDNNQTLSHEEVEKNFERL